MAKAIMTRKGASTSSQVREWLSGLANNFQEVYPRTEVLTNVRIQDENNVRACFNFDGVVLTVTVKNTNLPQA